jgi:KDO2-lipid IV(A) lauroyltransferase
MKLKKLSIVQFVEYAVAMVVALPFYLLPRTIAFRIGEWVGELLYWVMRRRRAIGYKNLNIAFGNQLSEQEKQHILRLTFKNLGKSLVEVIHFPKMSKGYLREKVHIVGQENYLAAMREGKGLIFLTAHIGNWEMSSHVWSAVGYPLRIVVRPLDNQFLDRVTTRLRTIHGNKLLTRRNGLKQIISALKNKEAVGILIDQNTLRSKGIFVDFFGKPACTTPVIAILALRYDVPVIPTFIIRTGFDTHTLYIGPEIDIRRTGDPQKDIEVNIANFNGIIEDFIRQYPEQWFWIHNRWKNQPRKGLS